MSSPFSSVSSSTQPPWIILPSIPGNFSPIVATGLTVVPEVGYGEGGYGEGGYDTPTQNIPSSSQPNWSIGSSR